MVEAFFFPPPPPPPPRHDQSHFVNGPSFSSANRGIGRGRGSFSGGSGRARGSGSRGRGNYIPGRINPGIQSSGFSPNSQRQNSNPPGQPDSALNGLKRGFATAFNEKEVRASRPQAAPSVPSFNADILALTTPSKSNLSSQKKPSGLNLLGLTPRNPDDDSASDHDEETTLAQKSAETSSDALQIAYKGRTATLGSPAEIAAWIAERRKNYPTAARVEAARLKAEETKSQRQAERDKAAELRRARATEMAAKKLADFKKKQGVNEDNGQSLLNDGPSKSHDPRSEAPQTGALSKEERLKQRLLKARSKARAAEEALAQMEALKNGPSKNGEDSNALVEAPTSTSLSNDNHSPTSARPKAHSVQDADLSDSSLTDSSSEDEDDYTSSSGSSTTPSASLDDDSSSSDSDSKPLSAKAPEQLSSKSLLPPAPPRPNPIADDAVHPAASPPRPLCYKFLRGQCRFGKRCRFSHERGSKTDPPRGPGKGEKAHAAKQSVGGKKAAQSSLAGRKGLFQVLMEKEQEEEKKLALAVIVRMGEDGDVGRREGFCRD